jgi:hypothetical protein
MDDAAAAQNAWDRTRRTVMVLATYDDMPLRDRLRDAYNTLLSPLEPQVFPSDLRARAQRLYDDMTWADDPDGSIGKIAATVNLMSDEQVRDAAKRCVDLYEGVCRHLEPVEDWVDD